MDVFDPLRADPGGLACQSFRLLPEPLRGGIILSFRRWRFRPALVEVLPGHAIDLWRGSKINNRLRSLVHRDRKGSLRETEGGTKQSFCIIGKTGIHKPRMQ